ncbi:hypothetical protein DXG01_004686 [Tephrocybe rancida]|nr:hypothetical protein DXG01_004686 [Tephrocybe rancida]
MSTPDRGINPTPAPPSLIHRLRNLLLRALLRALCLFSPRIDGLLQRVYASPGLPVLNPSESYWQVPRAPIAGHGSGKEKGDTGVPDYADVVVIGSGITGTAFVRTLLDWERDNGRLGTKVVMLEAREACSGATGRNGGHITPILYAQYPPLVTTYGRDVATQIMRFRLAHVPTLLKVAREEGLVTDAQVREVETWDVYLDQGLFGEAKQWLETYEGEMGEQGKWRVMQGNEAVEELGLKEGTAGCVGTIAGAAHPYRLVTGILERLLREYSSTFQLCTHTPCTSVSVVSVGKGGEELYELSTPRGRIRTPHVVHATNGWAAHLLPAMRGKIVPARGVMSAQNVKLGMDAEGEGTWAGTRSFVLLPESVPHTYDYLTQQPVWKGKGGEGRWPRPAGEMMLGEGLANGPAKGNFEEMGNSNDAVWDEAAEEYLRGALGRYFADVDGEGKGEENKKEGEREKDVEGRVKSLWSGVLGISVDGQPWVGRIPEKVAGRRAPRERAAVPRGSVGTDSAEKVAVGLESEAASEMESELGSENAADEGTGVVRGPGGLARPGEWMAAGYTGEGMVHAWLSGKALAYMVLGLDGEGPEAEKADDRDMEMNGPQCAGETAESAMVETGYDEDWNAEDLGRWFPQVFRVSEQRWASAQIEELFAGFLSG